MRTIRAPFLALLLLAGSGYAFAAQVVPADDWRNSCPLVCEDYDAFIVTHEPGPSDYDGSTWSVDRIYFARAGRIIADRHLTEDMRLHVDGTKWVLTWFDYGAHRRITATVILEIDVQENIEENNPNWWGAARRMSDLLPVPEPEARRGSQVGLKLRLWVVESSCT